MSVQQWHGKDEPAQNGKCKKSVRKESPFLPIVPISRIDESITYVELRRDWGTNPPPATKLS